MNKAAVIVMLLACAAGLPGCLLFAGAAIGAGAIVATAEDTTEVIVEHGLDSVYDQALAEVQRRGSAYNANRELYRFEGSIGGSRVWVDVSPEERGSARLRVRARRLERTLPDLGLARDLSNSIVENLFRESRSKSR